MNTNTAAKFLVAVESVGTVGRFETAYTAASECARLGWGAYVVRAADRKPVAFAMPASEPESIRATVHANEIERDAIAAVPMH